MDLINEAIRITLKTIDVKPEYWANLQNGGKTNFVYNQSTFSKFIDLNKSEQPIVECITKTNYSLITTERIISYRDSKFNELKYTDVEDVRPLLPKDSENIKPWTILKIKDKKNEIFLIQFDAGIPTYFVMNLIQNIITQIKFGRWFLNPSKGSEK